MGFKSRAKKLKDAAQAGKPKDSDSGKEKSGVVRCEIRGCKNWADKTKLEQALHER